MITNDNHKLADNNQSSLINNNCTNNRNTVVDNYCENMSLKISKLIASSRHDCVKEDTSVTSSAIALKFSEDRINNNCVVAKPSHGVDIMSHKNFTLSFDQHQSTVSSSTTSSQMLMGVGSETLLSPAEVPFGRRYAEISQFKNHPNVEW